MKHINTLDYNNCFADYFLQDCSVIDKNNLSFVMRSFEDTANYDSLQEQKVRKKIVWYEVVTDDELHAGCSIISNSEEIHTTPTHAGKPEALFINDDGYVFIHNEQGLQSEESIFTSTGIAENAFSALCTKTIHEWVYVCGHRGFMALRTDKNRWQDISIPAEQFPGPPLTLLDADGFAPDDLYAVTSAAGVFHFNGKAWARLPFPSNILLETVCCAPDGLVYVSGQAGTLFAGRGSRWKEVHAGRLTLPFTNTVWHDNALWCTNDYGVWTFAENKFQRAPVPDEVYFCSGHVSSRDGVLLLGGMNGAALHLGSDGADWQILYFQPEIMESFDDNEGS